MCVHVRRMEREEGEGEGGGERRGGGGRRGGQMLAVYRV